MPSAHCALRLKRVISQALGHDARRRRPTPTDGMARAVRIEPLTKADVASAVELAVRVLRVKPGDEAARSPVATTFLTTAPGTQKTLLLIGKDTDLRKLVAGAGFEPATSGL
jgi:hypothetical protein